MNKAKKINHDIFISYRRNGGEHLAWRIVDALQEKSYDAFMDADLTSGQFDEQLYYVIDNCKDFILILTPGALDRCINDDDWVRLEIERAKDANKNIVPIKTKDFVFPDKMPDSIEFLKKQQTIELYPKLFDDVIDRILIPMLISKPRKHICRRTLMRLLAGIIFICALIFLLLYILKLPPFSMRTPAPVVVSTQTITPESAVINIQPQNINSSSTPSFIPESVSTIANTNTPLPASETAIQQKIPVITEAAIDENNKPFLSWTGVDGASFYRIWYREEKMKGSIYLGRTDSTFFTFDGGKSGETFYFKVEAYFPDIGGFGDFSEEVRLNF